MNDGSVILTEIQRGQRLTRVSRTARRLQWPARTGGGPNGAAIGRGRQDLLCHQQVAALEWLQQDGLTHPWSNAAEFPTGGYIQRVDVASGKVETIYEAQKVAASLGPNDLVFDNTGGFWFTGHGSHAARVPQARRALLRPPDGSPSSTPSRPPDLAQRRRPLPGRDNGRPTWPARTSAGSTPLRPGRTRQACSTGRLRARAEVIDNLPGFQLPRQPGGGGRRRARAGDDHQWWRHRLRSGRLDGALCLSPI